MKGRKKGCLRMLSALLAAAFMAWPAQVQAAPREVGIEAQGVNLWAAFHNRWKLDVRDEYNRPVSAALLQSQLRGAAAAAAARVSSSRLPQARLVSLALELFGAVKVGFSSSRSRFPLDHARDLPGTLPSESRFCLTAVFLFLALAASARLFVKTGATDFHLASCRPLVLRC